MSDKKQLLEEGTVKRFMRLAELDSSLEENFFDRQEELNEMPEEEIDPDMDLAPEGELAPEDDLEPEAPVADEEVVKGLVDAIADAITAETGIPVDVTGDEVPSDLEVPLPAPEEEFPEEDEVDADLEAADVELREYDDEDALVAEVAKRVARRLLRESAKK